MTVWERVKHFASSGEKAAACAAVLLFFTLVVAIYVLLKNQSAKFLYGYVTFALPCLAGVMGGVGLYLDNKGETVLAKLGYAASYFALLFAFVYFIVQAPDMPGNVKVGLVFTIALFCTIGSVAVMLRSDAPFTMLLAGFHIVALLILAIEGWMVLNGLPCPLLCL